MRSPYLLLMLMGILGMQVSCAGGHVSNPRNVNSLRDVSIGVDVHASKTPYLVGSFGTFRSRLRLVHIAFGSGHCGAG